MQDIRQILGIRMESPYWEQACRQALQEPEQPAWLTEDYLRQLHEQWGILPDNLDVLIQARALLVQEKPLCLFVKTLLHILELHKPFGECFSKFEMPAAPENAANALAYDCLGAFPLLAHMPVLWKELEKRGLDRETLTRFFSIVDSGINECTEAAGRPHYSSYYFSAHWGMVFYKSIQLGRLRFERAERTEFPVRIFMNADGQTAVLMDGVTIHASGHVLGAAGCKDAEGAYPAQYRETEDAYEGYPTDPQTGLVQNTRIRLPKCEWKPVYKPGDGIMKVHIPFKGRFDKEILDRSYEKAREVLPRWFPEYSCTGFTTNTWLLAPELDAVLKEDSNIRAFGNGYHRFPLASSGKDIFEYVFKLSVQDVTQVDVENLPEDTSLQRGVKQLSREGVIFHEFGGFMPW